MYSSKSSAKRAALRQFGKNSAEGEDWEIVSGRPDALGRRAFDYIPGRKYDDPRQRAIETALGMRGYIGSPAHAEDVRERRKREG